MKPYFKKKDWTLYKGDCLGVLENLPAGSVDMVFADPPYNLSNNGMSCQNGRMVSVNKGKWDKSKGVSDDFDFHETWINACRRVLKPGGTIWISGTYHSIYQCGFALQKCGYHVLNDISWFKPNASPNLSCRFFTASHETLIWARRDKKAKHIFNYRDMKFGDWHERGDSMKKPDKQMRSVWVIGTPKPSEKIFGKHPTQKPMELLRRVVMASTNEGDVILDPFSGSSTTGLAAKELGRHFIGIDMEDEYLDLSVQRYAGMEEREKQEVKTTRKNEIVPKVRSEKKRQLAVS